MFEEIEATFTKKKKLLVSLFILKLFARTNIFKLTEGKNGHNTITLAKMIEKQPSKFWKLKCDINYLLQCKLHNLISTFSLPKIPIQTSNYLRNKVSQIFSKYFRQFWYFLIT